MVLKRSYRNTVGPESRFIETNPAIVEMFGFDSRKAFLKVSVSGLNKTPDDRNEYIEKMLKDGAVRNKELQLQRKDGSLFIGSVSAVAVKDEQGKIKYFDGTIEDISERKQTEKIVETSEKQFRELFQNNQACCFTFDRKGIIQNWNRAKAVPSGEEAVEYLKENTVDLLLLDMIMDPGINGRET